MGKRKQIEFVYVSRGKEHTEEEIQKALKVKEKVIRMLIDYYLREDKENEDLQDASSSK